jgi:hypothetical protein
MKTLPRRHFVGSLIAVLGTSAFAAPTKPKTIVLQSAWATHNIGDIGHTPGTLRVLEQHLPEVKVVLWAMSLDERVTAMLRARFPKVEIVQGSLIGKDERDEKLREAIRGADLFIRNSGMGQDTSFMQFCSKNGKPYGLFGQSYFPDMVEGKGAEERIALLNGASFIYTRETKTLGILKGAGVKTPVLEFGPDGCFGIDVRDDARGLATMQKLGLEERKFITLQLRTHTPSHPGVDDKRPQKLNPLHPTPEMIADDERRAAKYRDLITRWVQKTGHKVLIAPEVKKEMEHNKLRQAAGGDAEARGESRIFLELRRSRFDFRPRAHHCLPRAALTDHRAGAGHADYPHLLGVSLTKVLDVQRHRPARVAAGDGRDASGENGGDALCN